MKEKIKLKLNAKNKEILTMLILFISYLYYSIFIDSLLIIFNVQSNLFSTYAGDITFLFGIVVFYLDFILESFRKLAEIKKTKIFKFILVNVIAFILIILLTNILRYQIFADEDTLINDDLVYNLNIYYRIFKTLIFAVIAEELLFRKTIRDIIENKYVFIITSALVYSYMNIVFLGTFNAYVMFDFLAYFVGYCFLNYLYIKTDNILAPMAIKFTYILIFLMLSVM